MNISWAEFDFLFFNFYFLIKHLITFFNIIYYRIHTISKPPLSYFKFTLLLMLYCTQSAQGAIHKLRYAIFHVFWPPPPRFYDV